MREGTSGVVVGKVVDNVDPDHEGRIQVHFPWLGKDSPPRWCSVATAMAGGGRGTFFMPEIDDEVLVAFDQADFDHAFVVGFLWNAVQKPPSEDCRDRMIRSKNGHMIRFVDSTETAGDRGVLVVADAHGNSIVMANGLVSINSLGGLDLRGSTVTIQGRPVKPIGGEI